MKLQRKHIKFVQRKVGETDDGIIGTNTKKGVEKYFSKHKLKISPRGSKVVAVLQHYVGAKVDGFYGTETETLYMDHMNEKFDRDSVKLDVVNRPQRTLRSDFDRSVVEANPHGFAKSYSEIEGIFGEVGDESNMTTIKLPFTMRLAWDTKKKVTKIYCHKKIADPLLAVFKEIKEHYTLEDLQKYGLDLYGGCFKVRKMRGGSKWSTHSWAISIDINPSNNKLRSPWHKSSLSRVECKAFIQAFYNHGFTCLGVEKNYDSMHFTAAFS